MIRWFCMFNSIGWKDDVWTAWIIYQRGREASWLETSSPNTRSMKHILKTILLCFQDFGVAKTAPKFLVAMKYGNINKNQAKGVQSSNNKNLARKNKKQQTTISHLSQVPRFLGLRGGRKARRGFFGGFCVARWRWEFGTRTFLGVPIWSLQKTNCLANMWRVDQASSQSFIPIHSIHEFLRGPKKRSIEVPPNLRRVDVVIWDGSGLSEFGHPKKGFTCLRVINFWWCYRIPILYCNYILGVADFEPYPLFHVSLNNQDFFRLLVLLFT